MTQADQEKFLRRIRTALESAPGAARGTEQLFAEKPSAEDLELLDRVRRRTEAERRRLLERLREAAEPIHLAVNLLPDRTSAAAAIARLAAEKSPEWGGVKRVAAWQNPLLESLDLPQALGSLGIPVQITRPIKAGAEVERERERAAVIASFIGVTSADFCLADTATLVLRNRPGEPRSVGLVPSIHVAVITIEQVLYDMRELFALLRWDERCRPEGLSNYMSFISGPSKTADIEATMVHGAHGPREVHLFVVTGSEPG
jgi:L-lactate dehydrogenase complex protein LldG